MPSSASRTAGVNDTPKPTDLKPVAEVIASYRPYGRDQATWDRIGEFVRACATDFGPTNGPRAREVLRALVPFVLWCEADGFPFDREQMFTPDNIERFIDYGAGHLNVPSRATRRSLLRRVARTITTTAPWTPPPVELPGSMRHSPYTPTEIRGYWSLTQPTPLLRHRMRALLALGLGAGLTGREYYSSTGSDVSTTPDGVTVIQVRGARPRRVAVLDDYADLVRDLADTVGDDHLMGGELPRSESSRLWRLTQDLRIPGWLPPINAERLRSTWMAHHLNRGVPLPAFLEAAGLKTTKSCTLLLPYLRQPKPDEAAALMAGRR